MPSFAPDAATLTVFLAAAALLLVVPGPAVLYIVARSLDQGRGAGLVSTLGIAVGTLFHVAAAAFGLSALLVSSATAYSAVKYLGAAYLIYLGVRKLMETEDPAGPKESNRRSLRRLFGQGILVNLLNPKTALFFFAFLPQFVDVSRGSVASQILFLGFLFVALGVLSDALWAILAGSLGQWLRGNARVVRVQRYFSGAVFIGLGVATALSGSGRSK